MWSTDLGGNYTVQGAFLTALWSDALILISLIASMIVNPLATRLIVFKIFIPRFG